MRSVLLSGAVALSYALGVAANAYNTSAYTDSVSGIDFQRWCDDDTDFCFGIAMSEETTSTSFIGQLSVPLSSKAGWGGVSMSGSMTNVLLIAAWPDGDSAVGSLREAESYVSPSSWSGSGSLEEIPSGTTVNSTTLIYTFVCNECISGLPETFEANATSYYFGWALSASNPTTPSSASSKMPYHAAGYGGFEVQLAEARSSKYSTWASKAVKSTATTASTSASASATPSASVAPTVANATYDYIVVGGGAAGIVAAERLVEAKKSVLLIERGAASTVQTGATDALTWNSSMTGYDVPALGSVLESVGLEDEYLCDDTAGMAGCVLGGGTIINAMSFIYPQERDFDDKWPTGWKWTDVKAAAQRFYSRNPGSTLPSADGKRYDQGMYTVLSSFFDTLGWKHVDSQKQPNEKHMVYSYPSWDVDNGIRAGPVRSYLPLVEDDDNFTLKLNSNVLRLVRRGGRVTGVEVETSSGYEIINLRAGGRVVLAAGSLSTPRILINSGIGPSAQIETVKSGTTGITLPNEAEWISLPVGENLRDHPMFTITVDTNSNFTHFNTSSVLPGSDAYAVKLFDQGSGVMTQGGHRLQFWTSNVGSDGNTRFYQGSCSTTTDGVITMKLYLTHGATSSGVLGITSGGATQVTTDPWLQTAADKAAVTEFIEGLLADFKNSTGGFSVSGGSSASDIIAAKTSGDHYVGTAKMGTDDGRVSNGTSVVDLNAKVYGTENLYVVDASIHPDLPTGNTQVIVQIAAEAAIAKIIAQSDSAASASVSAVAASTNVAAATSVVEAATSVAEAVTTAAASVVTDVSSATVTSVEATATVGSISTSGSSEGSGDEGSDSGDDNDEGEGDDGDDDEYDCGGDDDDEDDDSSSETTSSATYKVAEATTTAGSVAAVTAAANADSGASTTTVWVTSTAVTTTTDVIVVATSTATVTVWPSFS